MILTQCLGSWRVLAPDHTEQSGPYMTGLWRKVFRDIKKDANQQPQSMAVFGIGLGGNIFLAQKFFPYTKVVAVDWDLSPITATLCHGKKWAVELKETPFLSIVESDALEFAKSSTQCFDIIIVDLFQGAAPADVVQDIIFITEIRRILNAGGIVCLNRYKDMGIKKTWRELFTYSKSIIYASSQIDILCKPNA